MDHQEFYEQFDIAGTVAFIVCNCFQRVALQFPDELLRYSVAVAVALKKELGTQRNLNFPDESENAAVRLFVMADTTFGSCCADEVTAMHADAQCIVHYGNACLSKTSRLPVWFVFGKAALDVDDCTTLLVDYASAISKPLLVMFGLQYSHEIPNIQQRLSTVEGRNLNVTFADIPSQYMTPSVSTDKREKGCGDANSVSWPKEHEAGRIDSEGAEKVASTWTGDDSTLKDTCSTTAVGVLSSIGQSVICERTPSAFEGSHYTLGGLEWTVPKDTTMEDYVILWIGDECPGLTNAALVFNTSAVVRYDRFAKRLVTDVANQSRVLKRRYVKRCGTRCFEVLTLKVKPITAVKPGIFAVDFVESLGEQPIYYCVERAKDANVVGIVVGTLGVAGYAEVIQKIRRMVESAGKKTYTLVMGKPSPAKLANFPECEVFVLVACPQTALIDSRDYLAPLLTPFEAELAFIDGKQWTGTYRLEFDNDLEFPSTSEKFVELRSDEPRYSFFSGGYVGRNSSETRDLEDGSSQAIVLSKSSEHALQLLSDPSSSIITTERSVLDIKSGAEYLATRTYQGLDINEGGDHDLSAVPGRRGRAAGYLDEATDR